MTVERDFPRSEVKPKREITKREVIRSEEFPENPEERLAAILAGFANSETKAITLLLLDEGPKTRNELWHDFIEATNKCWKINKSGPGKYCADSLVPIGMVAEELFLSMGVLEWRVGYTSTEAGEYYGKPIAAFLLKKAVEYGHSFSSIFGSTNSRGASRAPYNRARILELIVQNPISLREADIVNSLGNVDATLIYYNLRALDKAGLIRYTSVAPEKPGFARYQWRPEAKLENIKTEVKYPRRALQIAQILSSEKETMSCGDIQEFLQKLFPGKNFAITTISTVLNDLYRQGLVHAQFRGGKRLSEIELLEKGEQFYQEVILLIKEALNDGPALKEMRIFLPNWSSSAPDAACLYKKVASGKRRLPSLVRQRRILRLLQSHPGGLRPKEMGFLENLSQGGLRRPLNSLYEQGLVVKKRERSAVRYFLAEKSQKG